MAPRLSVSGTSSSSSASFISPPPRRPDDAAFQTAGLSQPRSPRAVGGTRSGRTYNPFVWAGSPSPLTVLPSAVDLGPGLVKAFQEEDRRDEEGLGDHEGLELDTGVEHEPAGVTTPPPRGPRIFSSPLTPVSANSTPSPSPSRSPFSLLTPQPAACRLPEDPPSPSPISRRHNPAACPASPPPMPSAASPPASSPSKSGAALHKQLSKTKRRRGKRQRASAAAAAQKTAARPKPRSSLSRRAMMPAFVAVDFDAAFLRSAKWAYTGVRTKRLRDQPWTVKDLLRMGFRQRHWDGCAPFALCDQEGRLVGVFPGRPAGPAWAAVIQCTTLAFEGAEKESRKYSRAGLVNRRRGKFLALNTGVSYGGGPKLPGNLKNSGPMQRVVDGLLGCDAIQCIAGFGSSVLALWAPKVYSYYEEHLYPLFYRFPGLRWPFSRSIYPTCTFNLGPATVCCDHVDPTNVPHGFCVITALGNFDSKKGGHLVLWEFRLIIDFPAGSTAAITSGSLRHANTPIGKGETRFSFTQYCPGSLLRFARHGFRPAKTISKEERTLLDGTPEQRWHWALSLFSMAASVAKDRLSVFGLD